MVESLDRMFGALEDSPTRSPLSKDDSYDQDNDDDDNVEGLQNELQRMDGRYLDVPSNQELSRRQKKYVRDPPRVNDDDDDDSGNFQDAKDLVTHEFKTSGVKERDGSDSDFSSDDDDSSAYMDVEERGELADLMFSGYEDSEYALPDPDGGYNDDDDDEYGRASQLPHVEEVKARLGMPLNNGRRIVDYVRTKTPRFGSCQRRPQVLLGLAIIMLFMGVGIIVTLVKPNRFDKVTTFLVIRGVSTMEDLKNKNSPQHKAALWIANVDEQRLSMELPRTFTDRYVMALLYYSMGGGSIWEDTLGFLGPRHICDWGESFLDSTGSEVRYGVTDCKRVNDAIEFGANTPLGIAMPSHGLTGQLPEELLFLEKLELLVLQSNPGLGGTFPSVIHRMPNLKTLSLQNCGLTGTLPDRFSMLPELRYLGLGGNQLSGDIPLSITDLDSLRALALDYNQLTGELDMFIGKNPYLTVLYLNDNIITGKISQQLMDWWDSLVEMDLSRNQISGLIPEYVFSHRRLKMLNLDENDLVGGIPDVNVEYDIESNTALEFLSLRRNKLMHEIPTTIERLVMLQYLDVSQNTLSGTVPESLVELNKLRYLFLGDNVFDPGSFPPFLLQMSNLEELCMEKMSLTGTIPDSLSSSLPNLVSLDLSTNSLNGTLSEDIGQLENLQYLLLRQNVLFGSLPVDALMKLSNLQRLLLEENDFTGSLNGICQSNDISLKHFGSDCGDSAVTCDCCDICCSKEDGDECMSLPDASMEYKIYTYERAYDGSQNHPF